MTYNEAIKIVARGGLATDPICMDAVTFVDLLRYLGVLKIDEPKGPVERAVDAMFIRSHACDGGGVITPRQAIEAIHSAGLKIVEK